MAWTFERTSVPQGQGEIGGRVGQGMGEIR